MSIIILVVIETTEPLYYSIREFRNDFTQDKAIMFYFLTLRFLKLNEVA